MTQSEQSPDSPSEDASTSVKADHLSAARAAGGAPDLPIDLADQGGPEEDSARETGARETGARETGARETGAEESSTIKKLRPHDFGVAGSWLNGGRSTSFQQSLHEMVRMTEDVLENWTAKIEVQAGELSTVSISSFEELPLHYVEAALDESGQSAFLLFDTKMALSIVTLMMGGSGDPGEARPLTPLEAGLLADLAMTMFDQFARELHLGPVRFKANHSDQSTMRDGVAEILMSFSLNLQGSKASGGCQLAISPLSLQSHMEIIDRQINGQRRNESPIGSAAAAALQPVVVPVVVGFAGIRVPAMDMANLHPGDVLRTGQSLGRQLVASVGNQPVFTVKAGQRGDRLVAEVLSLPKHDFPMLDASSQTNTSTGAPS